MTWTTQRIDLLKTLWADGQSASVIASHIGGITRNAVIGKVHRLGLPGRATATRTYAPRRRTETLRTRIGRTRRSTAAPRARPPRGAAKALPELAPAPPVAVTVATLTSLTCRWPIGDPFDAGFHFCGRTANESHPYCPHHLAIAHR